MYYLITPRRRLGVAIDKADLRNLTPVRGDIHINELHSQALGRTTAEAWIFTSAGGAQDILPRLFDARVTQMGTNGINITGIEQIGDCFYAQSWWCRAM